jgi:hypothetical protein
MKAVSMLFRNAEERNENDPPEEAPGYDMIG